MEHCRHVSCEENKGLFKRGFCRECRNGRNSVARKELREETRSDKEQIMRTGLVYFSMPAQYQYIQIPSMERFISSETDPQMAYKEHLRLKEVRREQLPELFP